MPCIWLVEDDEDIREIAIYALRTAGFEAAGFENGALFFASLEKREGRKPDAVLLDIMLPGDDGLTLLKKLRGDTRYRSLPIIMLTAKGSEHDKVKGLDLGADDYLAKPFGVMELISRIKALLRRAAPTQAEPQIIEYKNIQMDPARRTVTVDGAAVPLTYKEYELLHYLLANAGIALSRDKMLDAVWGYDFMGESRTLDMHIKSLRQKLNAAGGYIKTVRNVGYTLGE